MSFSAKDFVATLEANNSNYNFYSIEKAADLFGFSNIRKLPICLKILCENLLRHYDSIAVDEKSIAAMSSWFDLKGSNAEIAFHPSRVLMQDFTGVPAVVVITVSSKYLATEEYLGV